MPDDPEPKEFRVKVSAFVCQDHAKKRCRHVFPHITVFDADGVRKVMVDGAVFDNFVFTCQECGGLNYHKTVDAKLEQQNEILYKILAELHGQKIDTSAIIKTETNLNG